MKKVSLLLICLVVLSCHKKEPKLEPKVKPACEKPKSRFKMYEMSEMAALMEQMYVDNQRLKERIIKSDTIGKFPKHFLKIHTAKMTDEADNDDFFKEKAEAYIKAQQLIYSDSENVKQHFNDGVKACITCHEGKCGGPIARIKKLYIQ
ncbi:hypothetical protein G4D82_07445 [Flavobacterium sp. CYK-4]|uniref:hypothetical protein n=1 Tax=Flavobacterium lotistagni TaxID=2709660 RepID=UPI00140D384C|nr:hypothetical protein [Flavobacterium lotistagni]NHM07052.1 hypothetical protein [Flavobacterium lotistagni]